VIDEALVNNEEKYAQGTDGSGFTGIIFIAWGLPG
jgi:hypothetical protein